MRDGQRVVITGLGVVAATGIGVEPFWAKLLSGISAIGPLTRFNADHLPPLAAGELREDLHGKLPIGYFASRYSRTTRLAVIAAREAVRWASLNDGDLKKLSPLPIFLGVSTSDTDTIEKQVLRIAERGPKSASPFTAIASLPHAATSAIAASFGVRAHALTVSTGCPGAMDAIAFAARWIREGKAPVALAGGADAPITMLTVATFVAAGMIPVGWKASPHAGRPFDIFREGGVLAEGAAFVVLEEYRHARARGVRPLAEFWSSGFIADQPGEAPASGLYTSMATALSEGGLLPEDIGWINAHGPGDPALDRQEAETIHRCFGHYAPQVPVTSLKGTIGNPLAAAGACQLIASALGLQSDMIPPVANFTAPDPDCKLRIVAGRPLKLRCRFVLMNNHGFGGSNSSLIIRRYP